MPVDPILAPMLSALPPFPDHIEDWESLRAEELEGARLTVPHVAEPAPEGAVKTSHTLQVADGSIEVHVYTPPTPGPHPAHLYIHGGGWIGGTIHNPFIEIQMTERCLGADCVVIAVNYRKAPEYPFPTGLNDCYAALTWVHEHSTTLRIRPDLITVGGGSAGANLAAAVCLKARDEAGPPIKLQLLEVPALDLTLGSPSMQECGTGYGLTTGDLVKILTYYLTDPDDAKNPYASPLLATDLSNLPPAHIMSAEFDPLRDDGSRYAQRLAADQVPATFSLQAGHIHISCAFTAILPSARTWRAEVIRTLKSAHQSSSDR